MQHQDYVMIIILIIKIKMIISCTNYDDEIDVEFNRTMFESLKKVNEEPPTVHDCMSVCHHRS